jgi:hypothetical protein
MSEYQIPQTIFTMKTSNSSKIPVKYNERYVNHDKQMQSRLKKQFFFLVILNPRGNRQQSLLIQHRSNVIAVKSLQRN